MQEQHGIDEDTPLFVFDDSPRRVRCAVECFATYFRRTFEYDFVQYDADDTSDDARSCAALLCLSKADGVLPVGAAGLEVRIGASGVAHCGLAWAWVHPYFRGRRMFDRCSLFAQAWPGIRRAAATVGRLAIEPPISREMMGFLRARGEEFEGDSVLLKDRAQSEALAQ